MNARLRALSAVLIEALPAMATPPAAHALDPVEWQDQIGSFELTGTMGRDWTGEATAPNTALIDGYYHFAGTKSLRVTDTSTTGGVTVRRAKVAAAPGRRYHGQGFLLQRVGDLGAQTLSMEFYDGTGKVLATQTNRAGRPPLGVWTRVAVEGVAPAGTKTMSLVIRTDADKQTTGNWDGVTYVNSTMPNLGFEMPSTATSVVPNWQTQGPVTVAPGKTGAKAVRLADTSSTTSTWIQSVKLPAWGGVGMKASIAYKPVVGSDASVGIHWSDEKGTVLGSTLWALPSCATGTWCTLDRVAQAPAKATRALVRVGTSGAKQSTIDFDDVSLMPATPVAPPTSTARDLGAPLSYTNTDTTHMMAVGGNPKIATVVAGDTSRFQVVDVKTNKVEANIALPAGVTRSFGMTSDASDRVYLGTNSNKVLRWTPGGMTLEQVATAPGAQVFSVAASPDGKTVYGGTYDPAGAKVFKIDATTKAMTVLTPTAFKQDYARSITADSTHVYAGLGTDVPAVYSVPVNGGAPVDLGRPTGVTMTSGTITGLDVYQSGARRYLNMRIPGTPQLQMYDITRKSWTVPWNIQLEAIISPSRSKLFMSSTAQLHRYDDARDTRVNAGRPGMQPGRDHIVLEDANLDGTAGTWVMTYDPSTLKVSAIKPQAETATTAPVTQSYPISFSPSTQRIKRLAMGPGASNPSVYMTGFGGSSLAVRDTVTGTTQAWPKDTSENFGGIEGFGQNGKYAFLGTYVDSIIYRYDPTQTWKLGTNPVKIGNFGGQGQDRPNAWATSGTRTYFGTVPKYGQLGGGLGIITSPTATPTLVRNIIQDQSITSVAAEGTIVYGGTSRWGGLGSTPTATSAVAFAYDTATMQKKWTFTPPTENGIAPQVVTMVYRPDSKRLFAVVGDTIYELNVLTGKEIGRVNLTVGGTQDPNTSRWLGTAVADSNGLMYIRVSGAMWAVDPDSLMVSRVLDSTPTSDTLAINGDKLYYGVDTHLHEMTIKR